MSGSLKSFEELECWQAGTEVRRYVMMLVKKFPDKEKYSLIDNMTRAARSVTQNIAEGFGRYHFQENVQFCRQSRGSLHELLDQLMTANDEQYISAQEYERGKELVNKTMALLNGYINCLVRAKKKQLTENH